MTERGKAIGTLAASTVAFMVCFAVWMMYGVLVTWLVDSRIYEFDPAQVGWLIGIPVLSGSLMRIPAGVLTDRFGGRPVMVAIMLAAALAALAVSWADSFAEFFVGGLGFGVAGAAFAAGVAYTSVWFPPERQGTAIGIFGMGNAGAALTAALAPQVLRWITHEGALPEQWRLVPRLYAAALVLTAVLFWVATWPRRPGAATSRSLRERLRPLAAVRVWRFGLYYFLAFGGFVALSQWLVPYYVNVYTLSIGTAGALTAMFSLPSGLFRVAGGWLADRFGPRAVTFWALCVGLGLLVLLLPPRIELQAPGQGITVRRAGTVTDVSDGEVTIGSDRYLLAYPDESAPRLRFGIHQDDEGFLLLPTASFHQIPAVREGDRVAKGQLLVRGVTRIYFQANVWIFTGLVVLLGIVLGTASGAIFKYITACFPGQVGLVGGAVSMLGALGGFGYPILFGYLLRASGIWTTSWLLLAVTTVACLVWMHVVVRGSRTTTIIRPENVRVDREAVLG